MKWLQRWLEAARDQDKFWREWHKERRAKRQLYWEGQRRKHLLRAFSAGRMVTYYTEQPNAAPSVSTQGGKMKGHNELHFNAATMIRAMQEYLDRALTDGHKVTVTQVTLDRTGVSTGTDAFIVHVEEPPSIITHVKLAA